jgi:pimeloyl-ACP methyl ester carboxylesterase
MLSPNAVGSIDAIEYLSGASTEVRSEGSGPPLILLHGLQSDLTIWDGVCEHLRSVERIRLNFPGRGKSARGSDTWHSLEYFYSIGRFAELLHSLVQKLDRRVSIAGWSMSDVSVCETNRGT